MLQMEYNSARELLTIPEYGRNVQKLILHAKNIEDIDERNQFTYQIVELMLQMSPQSKNMDDARQRIWQHVFHIAGYDLEIALPEGIEIHKDYEDRRPEPMDYPAKGVRFRHYGHHVQNLIAKALQMEEGPKRDGFVETIGNYMKLAYKTWNREHYISDEIIINDLETLSNGELTLRENASLDTLTNANRRRKRSNERDGRDHRDRDNRSGRDRDYRDRNDRDYRNSRGGRDHDRDYRDRGDRRNNRNDRDYRDRGGYSSGGGRYGRSNNNDRRRR